MKHSDDKQAKNNLKLLSDSDFVALMDAEYTSQTDANDELAKKRGWNAIQAKLIRPGKPKVINPELKNSSFPRKNSVNRLYTMAAMLLVAAIILPTVLLDDGSDGSDIERTKGHDTVIDASLQIYTLDNTGKLVRSEKRHKVGTTLLFKVHATPSGLATLVSSRNGKLIHNNVVYKLTQGSHGQLLSKDEQVYGYMIEPIDKILQFCVIVATDAKTIDIELDNIENIWSRLPARSCATINVIDSLE